MREMIVFDEDGKTQTVLNHQELFDLIFVKIKALVGGSYEPDPSNIVIFDDDSTGREVFGYKDDVINFENNHLFSVERVWS